MANQYYRQTDLTPKPTEADQHQQPLYHQEQQQQQQRSQAQFEERHHEPQLGQGDVGGKQIGPSGSAKADNESPSHFWQKLEAGQAQSSIDSGDASGNTGLDSAQGSKDLGQSKKSHHDYYTKQFGTQQEEGAGAGSSQGLSGGKQDVLSSKTSHKQPFGQQEDFAGEQKDTNECKGEECADKDHQTKHSSSSKSYGHKDVKGKVEGKEDFKSSGVLGGDVGKDDTQSKDTDISKGKSKYASLKKPEEESTDMGKDKEVKFDDKPKEATFFKNKFEESEEGLSKDKSEELSAKQEVGKASKVAGIEEKPEGQQQSENKGASSDVGQGQEENQRRLDKLKDDIARLTIELKDKTEELAVLEKDMGINMFTRIRGMAVDKAGDVLQVIGEKAAGALHFIGEKTEQMTHVTDEQHQQQAQQQ